MTTTRCAESSRAAGEPIAGTALDEVRTWIVLEDRSPWGRKAFQNVPDEIRERLAKWELELDAVRLQAVRKKGRERDAPHRMFVADAARGLLWALDLPKLGDLIDLDLAALLSGETNPDARPLQHLLLVCTHGARDVCCAKDGVPIYNALVNHDMEVWQTSHVGGHRFAPNVVHLPSGWFFGAFTPEAAPQLIAALARGEVLAFDKLRGRSTWPRPGQAAALAVRRALGAKGLADISNVETSPTSEQSWTCTVHVAQGGVHEVTVEAEASQHPIRKSCDVSEAAPQKTYLAHLRRS